MVSGIGIVTVQGERLNVQTGDLVLVVPENVHSFEQLGEHTMTYYNILFHPFMLHSEYADFLQEKGRTLSSYIPKGDPLNSSLQPLLLELILNRKLVNSD